MLDVALVHAPSVYDFRNRDDLLFAYLGNSDSVHVSPIFEMPPSGLLAIQQYLSARGKTVVFYNIASHMLRDDTFDVEAFFARLETRLLGIDLHWLAHAQGALELAAIYKRLHPEGKVYLGGISASYFHTEVIRYPQIDYVIRGVDTLQAVEQLIDSENEEEKLLRIPGLTWMRAGVPVENEMGRDAGTYTVCIDWKPVFEGKEGRITPYNMVIPQVGCRYDCRWCGGSRYAGRKHLGQADAVYKSAAALVNELNSILASGSRRHTVTMINYWHENDELLEAVHDAFCSDRIDRVHVSVRSLPDPSRFAKLEWGKKLVVELSPDSQRMDVSRNCGHGHYTMEEMERFINALLGCVHSFEIYFMIGIPGQAREDVRETVKFCGQLLQRYEGKRVIPFICPMLPFLDPGSLFFDRAEKFGYRILRKSFEEHRTALLCMHWGDRLNYETRWMSRRELVDITYEAVRELTLLKAKYRIIPAGVCDGIVGLIGRTQDMLARIDCYQAMPDSPEKENVGCGLRGDILEYNREQLSRVRSQQRPLDLGFTRLQWFDTEEAFAAFEGRETHLC